MNTKTSIGNITRRGFGLILGAAGLISVLRLPVWGAARLGWDAQPEPRMATERRYRADARVVLFSVPILRRPGVGGGSAAWSEEAGIRLLEFKGYSLPERAAGLNRLGFLREMSRLEPECPESIYFGLMTAVPEESAEQAQKALHQTSKELLYRTIEGRVSPGGVETVTADFGAPARFSVAQQDELVEMARRALSSAPKKPAECHPGTGGERTFLQALADLMQDPARSQTRYIYNGRRYELWLHKYNDPKAAGYFRERGLIAAHAGVTRAAGGLRPETGGKESNFQLWVETGAARPLPLRIEYQARSYLRLMFETE